MNGIGLQDKLTQKEHLDNNGIPVARFMSVEDERTEQIAVEAFGLPLMLKSRRYLLLAPHRIAKCSVQDGVL